VNRLEFIEIAQYGNEQARDRQVDSPAFATPSYWIDFLRNDTAGMRPQAGRLPAGDRLLPEATTAAYRGQLSHARDLTQTAIASATQANAKDAAEALEAVSALREAQFGSSAEAISAAMNASKTPTGWDTRRGPQHLPWGACG
jgi:hypothetical protein